MFLLLHYAKKEIKSFCLSQCGAKFYTGYRDYHLDWRTILIWVKTVFLFIRRGCQQINAFDFIKKKDVNTVNAFDRWVSVNRISERREADAHWAVQDSIRYTQSHTRWYFQLHFSIWVHWIYIEYIIQHIGLFKIASFVRGFGECYALH